MQCDSWSYSYEPFTLVFSSHRKFLRACQFPAISAHIQPGIIFQPGTLVQWELHIICCILRWLEGWRFPQRKGTFVPFLKIMLLLRSTSTKLLVQVQETPCQVFKSTHGKRFGICWCLRPHLFQGLNSSPLYPLHVQLDPIPVLPLHLCHLTLG